MPAHESAAGIRTSHGTLCSSVMVEAVAAAAGEDQSHGVCCALMCCFLQVLLESTGRSITCELSRVVPANPKLQVIDSLSQAGADSAQVPSIAVALLWQGMPDAGKHWEQGRGAGGRGQPATSWGSGHVSMESRL
jgi:hypothetical protein